MELDDCAPRSVEEMRHTEEMARKSMRESSRQARTAMSRRFNSALRSHGIDPKKFRSLVKSSHHLTAEEFEEIMWRTCRLSPKED